MLLRFFFFLFYKKNQEKNHNINKHKEKLQNALLGPHGTQIRGEPYHPNFRIMKEKNMYVHLKESQHEYCTSHLSLDHFP